MTEVPGGLMTTHPGDPGASREGNQMGRPPFGESQAEHGDLVSTLEKMRALEAQKAAKISRRS
ncbi:MAG: hypothetical protein JRN34_00010 [Nitrososphaerota archaeon]|nr:hypothetical protein [Nitrososphaerota archaeon]